MKNIDYRYILWNRTTGSYIAIVDSNIRCGCDSRLFPKFVFVWIEGNSIKDTQHASAVQMTVHEIDRLWANLIPGKRRHHTFKENVIRHFHPEFNIEKLDELVEKATLFHRIAQ